MKKTILILIVFFLSINTVKAVDIENDLKELQKNITEMENTLYSMEDARLNKMYPIGSIYITTQYSTIQDVKPQ